MTFNEYQKQAVETAIYGTGSKIIYPALGLANEAGEALGKIKKVLRDKDGKFDLESKKEISKECGDTLWYLCALVTDLGFTLDSIATENIAKLQDRKNRGVISGSGDNR